jgi:acyl carrier protein
MGSRDIGSELFMGEGRNDASIGTPVRWDNLRSSPHGGVYAALDIRGLLMSEAVATPARIKRLIVESLNLEGMRPELIEDETPLFGEGLGLDSVDALELVVALEKEFGIKIRSQEIGREVFSSVSTLSQFIEGRT